LKRRALVSVSDKSGVVEFATALEKLGFEIVSTGGTHKLLKESGVDAIEIDEVTKFPEVFDGRVKTLNPFVHGGILYRRDMISHVDIAKKHNITAIDLVCVNLYPFKQTIERSDDFDEIIENIDIGGPAMVRSAAKNFKDVIIVTDPLKYSLIIDKLTHKSDSYEFRRDLMIEAYEHTAAYDSMIANYMNSRCKSGFAEKQFIVGTKVQETRYGENPHQQGALYEFDQHLSNNLKTLKGEASFNNLTDISSAVKIAAAFGESNSVCIVKHGNPCGFAIKNSLKESYIKALECDNISAFGGVVAVNGVVDKELALQMNKIFLEVIVAAKILPEALEVFESKKRLKLFEHNSKTLLVANDKIDFKHIDGGFVYQDADSVDDSEVDNATCKSDLSASTDELNDAKIAWKIAALTKSNSVVYVKDSIMVAVGMGMTSRVDAAKSAIAKAKDMGIDISGCALASEAFFPFRDSIDEAAKAGVKTIIEPGGSIRDAEVIDAANEHKMALYFTGIRHFLH